MLQLAMIIDNRGEINKYLYIFFQIKYKSCLILKLKDIKFRDNNSNYLSFYLHHSFFCYFGIQLLYHHQVLKPMQKFLIVGYYINYF